MPSGSGTEGSESVLSTCRDHAFSTGREKNRPPPPAFDEEKLTTPRATAAPASKAAVLELSKMNRADEAREEAAAETGWEVAAAAMVRAPRRA